MLRCGRYGPLEMESSGRRRQGPAVRSGPLIGIRDIKMKIRDEFQEEAEYIGLQGGEMPEVTLYESLNVLAEKGLNPTGPERKYLEEAVVGRYRDIIRRDLALENRTESFFRAPERARINWNRLGKFARDHAFDLDSFRVETGRLLREYLAREELEIARGKDYNTLGLDPEDLVKWLEDMGLAEPEILELADRVASVRTLKWQRAIAAERRKDARDRN